MAGYIRQSSFSDGDTITAALFNNEYNQLLNAFSNTTGHAHDGTTAEGPVIGLIGDAGETSPNNKVLIDTTNNFIEFYVEVSSAPVQQLYISDGAIIPVTDSDVDLGTTSLRFKDTYTDTVTTTGNVSVGGNLTVTGTTTFNGGTITMGDAATDNVVFGADIDSHIIPDDDDTYDLGSSSQQWRNLYVDGTANLDTVSIEGDATFADSAKAIFGAGSDLQIYHDGSNSYITDVGTGALVIQSNGTAIVLEKTDGENMILANPDGDVKLYYNGSEKLATTSTGVDVTGNVESDTVTIGVSSVAGSEKLRVNGTVLTLGGSVSAPALGIGDTNTGIYAPTAGELGWTVNGTQRLFLDSTGVDVTGTATMDGLTVSNTDGSIVKLESTGTGLGSGAVIGDIQFFGNDASVPGAGIKASITATTVAALGDDSQLMFSTSDGTTNNVNRMLIANNGDISFYEDTGTTAQMTWDASADALTFTDNTKAIFGAGSDLQIYHDGSNSYIADAGTGSLLIDATNLYLRNASGEEYASFIADGAANLKYNGSTKIVTTSTGIDVTGAVLATRAEFGGIETSADRPLMVKTDTNNFALHIEENSGAESWQIGVDADGDLGFHNSATAAASVTFNDSGNVGINTSSPTSNLHIKTTVDNSLAQGLVIERSANTDKGYINYNGGGFQFRSTVGDPIVFGDTSNEQMRITSTGIDVTGTAVTDGLTVAGEVSVDGGSIKLDGNYPVGASNVALGNTALDSITSDGSNNTAIGDAALTANTTGTSNVAVGSGALDANTTANDNTALGRSALGANTTGARNTALGRSALGNSSTASNNTAVGYHSLVSNTTGTANSAFGYLALDANTTGNSNSAFGGEYTSNTSAALSANTTGSSNAAFGTGALAANTTASNNTSVGTYSMYSNTTGTENAALGKNALRANTTGTFNVAVGSNALDANTTSHSSTAIGYNSLSASTGASNTAVGKDSLESNIDGANNVAIGADALAANTTGTKNVCIGSGAGDAITTGSNNTIIGDYAGTTTLADTIVLASGTTERMRIDGSGNLGLGTTSPAVALHAESASAQSGRALRLAYDSTYYFDIEQLGAGGVSYNAVNATSGGHRWEHNGSEKMRLDDSGNLGIGTTSPTKKLHVRGSAISGASADANSLLYLENNTNNSIQINSSSSLNGQIRFGDADSNYRGAITYSHSEDALTFTSAGLERARIDSSGNLLVGKTTNNNTDVGVSIRSNEVSAVRDGGSPLLLNRLTSDGDIAVFRKDSTTVGSIGANGGYIYVGSTNTNIRFHDGADAILPATAGGASRDNAIDFGSSGARFKDFYLSGVAKVDSSAYISQGALTSSSGSVAWDAAAKANAYHVTTENTTFAAPSNAVEGAIISVEIAQGGTARTVAWNTVFEFAASTAPTVTATANKTDIFSFRYNGSVWQEIGRVQNMAQT